MWALVQALGLICLPLTVTVFHNLPDRGWAFSKTLALTLFAFGIWFPLIVFHALPYSQLFILAIALALLAGNALSFWRSRQTRQTIVKVVRSNLGYVLLTEFVFFGMVFLLGFLRSYRPDIRSFEAFMDEGLITSIMRSPHFPPNDMWFAGYSINYYYYAHFTLASLAKLIGQAPSIAFNTGISMFFGLTAVNLFGVTTNIVTWAKHLRAKATPSAVSLSEPALEEQDEQDEQEPTAEDAGETQPPLERQQEIVLEPADSVYPKLLGAIPFGMLSMIIGLILGNLAATQQWWIQHGNAKSSTLAYDWFSPSRVIDRTINEFPAFSFLLSCFHAHVLTLAFTVLAIALAFNLLLESEGLGLFVFGRGWRLPITLIMTALTIGELFVMNGWDLPTYAGLVVVCIALQQWLLYERKFSFELVVDIASACLSLLVLAFLFFLPFYLTYIAPAQGIGLVQVADRSPLGAELLIYGLFLFLFLSLLVYSSWREPLFSDDAQLLPRFKAVVTSFVVLFVADILALILIPNSTSFVFMATIGCTGIIMLFQHIYDRAHVFTLLLGVVAFFLVALCEVVFLKDAFGDQPRLNTVFKFYFQAWSLLSIVSGCALFFLVERVGRSRLANKLQRRLQYGGQAAWGLALVLLLLASMTYPLLAPSARLREYNPLTGEYTLQPSNNLDGMTYLQHCYPPDPNAEGCNDDIRDDYPAIRWINEHIEGDPVIVEAVGTQTYFDFTTLSRISAFTGLPTLMGWSGHEYQWRLGWLTNNTNVENFNHRQDDVRTIYTDSNPQNVLTAMAKYNAQYLYVGPLERIWFGQKQQNGQIVKVDLQRFETFMQVVYQHGSVTIYKVR